jgi:hypothetical protein
MSLNLSLNIGAPLKVGIYGLILFGLEELVIVKK